MLIYLENYCKNCGAGGMSAEDAATLMQTVLEIKREVEVNRKSMRMLAELVVQITPVAAETDNKMREAIAEMNSAILHLLDNLHILHKMLYY